MKIMGNLNKIALMLLLIALLLNDIISSKLKAKSKLKLKNFNDNLYQESNDYYNNLLQSENSLSSSSENSEIKKYEDYFKSKENNNINDINNNSNFNFQGFSTSFTNENKQYPIINKDNYPSNSNGEIFNLADRNMMDNQLYNENNFNEFSFLKKNSLNLNNESEAENGRNLKKLKETPVN